MRTLILLVLLCIHVSFAQPDTIRVACVGNSITYGSTIPNPALDSYPGQLDVLLGAEYDVNNYGVSGCTMLKKGDFPLWHEPEFEAAVAFQPHIVIILLGTNDSKPQNWQYKDEFVPDYVAMIDTFRALPSEPTVYVCYPPPAFSVQWGIRDSVITTDIIPMVTDIVQQTGVETIDFYQPFTDKRHLFPDDIHPSAKGSTAMAEIVAEKLMGWQFSTIQDENLARGKPIDYLDDVTCRNLDAMLDGAISTRSYCDNSSIVVIDLLETQPVDQFQILFPDRDYKLGPQYQIEVSTDSTTWMGVVDNSVLEDSTRDVVIDTIEPTDARFVRFTLYGYAFAEPGYVYGVSEFRVLKHTGYPHNPVLYPSIDRVTSRSARMYVHVVPTDSTAAGMILSEADAGEPFQERTGVRSLVADDVRLSLRPDEALQFTSTMYISDKRILAADTLAFDWSITGVEERESSLKPDEFRLIGNYPNPFNSTTMIQFSNSTALDRAYLRIFNATGQRVREFNFRGIAPGTHQVSWNAVGDAGLPVSSGVYFYKLYSDHASTGFNKMILLR